MDIERMLELDELAWYNKSLPKNASHLDRIYYLIAAGVYSFVRSGKMELQEAKMLKQWAMHYFEQITELARDNGRIITELNKLTAPSAELSAKQRDELLEIVLKMQALVSGLIKAVQEEVPEMLRVSCKGSEEMTAKCQNK